MIGARREEIYDGVATDGVVRSLLVGLRLAVRAPIITGDAGVAVRGADAACDAGRTLEVLVEGANPRDPTQAMGRTRHNKLCFFKGDGAALKGELVDVRIEGIRAYTLTGSIA